MFRLVVITSPQNRKLKDMRRLARCKGDPGQVLLEGTHLIREAIAADVQIDSVLATPEWIGSPEGERIAATMPIPVKAIDSRLLDELADADSPRGVVAAARLPTGGLPALPRAADGIYAFLEGVQDPGNVGAIARVAEAAGATALALDSLCAHAVHPRAMRASAGSLLRLPCCRTELDPLLHHLEAIAPTVVGLAAREGASLFEDGAVPSGPLLLLLGSEGRGLSSSAATRVQTWLHIPMQPPVDSLNVAVAAALALYELSRRSKKSEAASERLTRDP